MWIFEQPLPILFLGVVVVAVLAGGLVQTGRVWLLYAIAAAVVLTAGMLVLERLVVTQAEAVEDTLRQIATHLERDETDDVLGLISRDSESLRQEARQKLRLAVISDVRIKNNLQVQVQSDRTPRLAQAKFNAVIRASDRAGQIGQRIVPRYFKVNFRHEDGQWRVRDYEMTDPRDGIRN